MVDSKTSPEILDIFNIQYIPTNFVLDKDGKIAFKRLHGEKLESTLTNMLTK
jgi:hypothetical protein